jgi:hypothetical protein
MKLNMDESIKLNDVQLKFYHSQANWSAQQPVEMLLMCGPVSTMDHLSMDHLSKSLTFFR